MPDPLFNLDPTDDLDVASQRANELVTAGIDPQEAQRLYTIPVQAKWKLLATLPKSKQDEAAQEFDQAANFMRGAASSGVSLDEAEKQYLLPVASKWASLSTLAKTDESEANRQLLNERRRATIEHLKSIEENQKQENYLRERSLQQRAAQQFEKEAQARHQRSALQAPKTFFPSATAMKILTEHPEFAPQFRARFGVLPSEMDTNTSPEDVSSELPQMTSPSLSESKVLTVELARQFLNQAGGNRNKARQMASDAGYTW